MPTPYPQWIDEYAKATHNAFTNMIPGSWGPLDLFQLLGFLNGLFLQKVYEALCQIKKQGMPVLEVAKSAFSSPSALRVSLLFLFTEYIQTNPKNQRQYKEVIEYLVEILTVLAKRDMFALKSNIIHTDKEIEELLQKTEWQKGTPEAARALGKFYTSVSNLSYALYRDFFNDEGCERYGPYDASTKFGKDTILVMTHFPRIKPIEIWPRIAKLKYSDIKIFQVYKNVSFRCELWGVHSIWGGDTINNLVAFALFVDGKRIDLPPAIEELTEYFGQCAMEQFLVYDTLSKEDLKNKNLEWLCYKFIDFFKLAGMDWRPTQAMRDAVKDKDVPDRFELETFPSFEEYTTSPKYEVYWLKDLYKDA